MKFEWITDWETIWSDKFQTQWLKWMEESDNAHVFFHPAMAKAWVETYMPLRDIRPLFCVVSQGNMTIFIPMVIWNKNWKNAFAKTIVPVGYSDFDYHDPIVIGDCDFKLFWKALYSEIHDKYSDDYDYVELDGIREGIVDDSQFWELKDESPKITLSDFESYEMFSKTLKSKERGDINRQIRRLNKLENFEYKVFKPDEVEEALQILPTVLEHHSLRWPNAYKAPHYHENLIKNALPLGLLHFSQISVDNKAICWNISFVFDEVYYFYMPTYIEEYKTYSPGKTNMFLSIQSVFERNFKYFDLLSGAEEYKNKLPVTSTLLYGYKQKNTTFTSSLKDQLLFLRTKLGV